MVMVLVKFIELIVKLKWRNIIVLRMVDIVVKNIGVVLNFFNLFMKCFVCGDVEVNVIIMVWIY